EEGNSGMLHAAHIAGKAINISQTTAGHAMCYKITSIFHCAHGHAAMLCNRELFPWMLANTDKCIDPRGTDYLRKTFDEIGQAMGCNNAPEASEKLKAIFDSLELEVPKATEDQIDILKTSVNPVRLKNHPIRLDISDIEYLYRRIL
ncbi:MAG: iron-containing alcohol dehydrogenase, partial [Lachnospiraceae bacterium]|nr:iron-containing alcohol dehydrogenase [Lachnospiraceae bacterium]